jgi:hypothetical protein
MPAGALFLFEQIDVSLRRSTTPTATGATRLIAAGHDDFGVFGIAHPIDGSRDASPNGIFETPRPLRDDRNRAIGTADDCSARCVKRRSGAEVQDETCVLGRALPRDGGADLYAERRIGFSTRDAGSDGSGVTGALDVRNAGIRTGAAPGTSVAQASWVGFRADVLIGAAARLFGRQVTGGESEREQDQSAPDCRAVLSLHDTPHCEAIFESTTALVDAGSSLPIENVH